MPFVLNTTYWKQLNKTQSHQTFLFLSIDKLKLMMSLFFAIRLCYFIANAFSPLQTLKRKLENEEKQSLV